MRLSCAIPVYDGMPNGEFFLKRCLDSLHAQTFRDFEVIITKDGKMAENTNSAIKKCSGEIIKVLYQDDYLAHKDALQVISDAFTATTKWLVTACKYDPGTHVHYPSWNDGIHEGINTIGSPSVLTIRNDNPLLFDESLGWLLDCDLYKRMYNKHGLPLFLNDVNVAIGIHEGQSTHLMGDEIKIKEHQMLKERYDGKSF